jgi:carbon-monoxide dehydrogenase large subunit
VSDAKPGQGVGARVLRKEDARHLHGRGQFVPDMILPGQREVAFFRSPVAHARLLAIRKPAGSEGRVFVREDMPDVKPMVAPSSLPIKPSEQHHLAYGKVRFVGEPIACAIAKTRAEAEDLAEQVEVDFEELPALVNSLAAHKDKSIRVHEHWDDNVFLTLAMDNGFDEQSKKADVVVRREIQLARQSMNPLDGKGTLAVWDDRANQLVLYSSSQTPHLLRIGVARFLGMAEEQVRVIAPDVGGGFGYKCIVFAEDLCVAWLAMKYRRPFRYIEDRREHLVAGANSRQHHYSLTAYASKEGRLLALDAEIHIDGGAYSNWPFTIGLEPGQATGNLPGPYDFRGYRVKTHCIATNKPGFLPYRGVARTGVCFAMELMIDAIARAVDRDPYDVRLANLVRPEQMPYDNISRKHYDSGDYPRALKMAREKLDVEKWRERQKVSEAKRQRGEGDGRLIGIGFASYCEQSAHGTSVFAAWGLPMTPGFDQAAVRITAGGGLEVRVGVQSHGQGMETTIAQLAHEVLGIDIARIQVVHGDTGTTPFSTGTYASRSIVMAGGATVNACRELIPRLTRIGAHLLKCEESEARFEKGLVVGPGGSVTLGQIAEAWYMRPEWLPADASRAGLEASVAFKPKRDTGAFSYASHAVAVAVDTETGQVEILDYVIVEDCGTLVNPMVVEGQTIGGVAQGIGTALYEEQQYDANGQPNASTLADYLIPGPTEVPAIRVFHLETPSPYTEFGIKGMGEGGAIAPPAVIFNAVNNALTPYGVEVNETPLTPERLMEALERAKEQPRREAA